MKLIKIYGLITAIVALSFAVMSFLNFDKEGKLSKNGSPLIKIPIEKEVLPEDQWMDAIIGTWDITFTIQNPNDIVEVTGEIISSKDKGLVTFSTTLFYQYYYATELYAVDRSKKYLSEIGKANVQGNIIFKQETPDLYHLGMYDKAHYICFASSTPNLEYETRPEEIDFCKEVGSIITVIGNTNYFPEKSKLHLFSENEILVEYNSTFLEKPVLVSYKRKNGL